MTEYRPVTTPNIQEIANHLQPGDTLKDLSKRLNISERKLRYRIDKHPDTWELLLFDQWDEALNDVEGWITVSDLEKLLPLATALYHDHFKEYQEYRETHGKRPISRRNSTIDQKYFIPPRHNKRHEQNLQRLNEEGERIYRVLIGTGRKPGVMAATAMYLSTGKTQKECAEEFAVSEVSIRNCRDYLEKQGNE